MYRILWNGQSAMNANQNKLEIISNNISNMNTTGYKKVDSSFKDLMNESLEKNGYPHNNRGVVGTGVKLGTSVRDNSQGILLETGVSTNFAIDGEGMFKVTDANGKEFYTRDGNFMVDVKGDIVNARGEKLVIEYEAGQEGIEFNNKNIFVDKKGDISIKDESGKHTKLARIPLYSAIGDETFRSVGNNLYKPVEGVNVFEVSNTHIYQGSLEASNIDVGEEFSEMIMTQRAFQLGSKSVNIADEMWGMVNDLRR